jgi:hypothetical protein
MRVFLLSPKQYLHSIFWPDYPNLTNYQTTVSGKNVQHANATLKKARKGQLEALSHEKTALQEPRQINFTMDSTSARKYYNYTQII